LSRRIAPNRWASRPANGPAPCLTLRTSSSLSTENREDIMKFARLLAAVVGLTTVWLTGGQAFAEETNVAVAANFTAAVKEIAAAFKHKSGDEAVLSFGSTGQLYTQITQDAPFQIFLAADEARPKKAVDAGLAVPESRFTYAVGKLVLWSRSPDLVKGEATLKSGNFTKLSICNPATAP